MKAISIKQPWASLIVHGIKDIENRTWKTNFRGRVYIHASAKIAFVGSYRENLPHRFWIDLSESERSSLINSFQHRGSIIGEVDIIDCVINHSSIWAEKTEGITDTNTKEFIPYKKNKPIYNWVLENAVLFPEPILDVKGKLSFWDYPNIASDPEEENGKLFCHCQIPVKEENQVWDLLGQFRCIYCDGIWYR